MKTQFYMDPINMHVSFRDHSLAFTVKAAIHNYVQYRKQYEGI